MHKYLDEVCSELEALAEVVTNADTSKEYVSRHGWNHPILTRFDLAEIPLSLVRRLKEANIEELGAKWGEILEPLPEQINHLAGSTTIPYMFNGHGHQAIPAYLATLEYVRLTIEPVFQWETLKDTKLIPTKLMSRLRSIETSIEGLEVKKERLEEDIKLIQEAREAAESLPTDLASLKDARNILNKYNSESAELKGKMDVLYNDTTEHAAHIQSKKKETDKLVEQCEEAYRITTTKGLAAAFDERAKKLSQSMWIWVVGLIIALIVGSLIGSQRLAVLSDALKQTNPSWGIIS